MWSLSSAIMHYCNNVWSCLPLEHIKGPGHQILLFLKPAGHIPAVGPLHCLFAVLNTLPSVPTGLSFCHSLNCVPHCLWMWPCLEIVFADVMTKVKMRSSWISCCSVTQSCPTLCNPMNCSTPGFPVLHYLPEFVQTHVESGMPSNHLILFRPLPLPSIFPSIRVFSKWASSLNQVAKVLELQLQHQSFQWIFRIDFF